MHDLIQAVQENVQQGETNVVAQVQAAVEGVAAAADPETPQQEAQVLNAAENLATAAAKEAEEKAAAADRARKLTDKMLKVAAMANASSSRRGFRSDYAKTEAAHSKYITMGDFRKGVKEAKPKEALYLIWKKLADNKKKRLKEAEEKNKERRRGGRTH